MHLLASLVLAQLVVDCFVGAGVLNLVRTMKFAELAGANMLALTNVAICVNLALIVHVRKNLCFVFFNFCYFFDVVLVDYHSLGAAEGLPVAPLSQFR